MWGALGTHVISSMLRKAHIARLSSDPIRAFFRADLQTIAGRVLLPLLSIHVVLNRIAPSSEAMPINEVSPSEMGMEYVAYGFSRWPALTSALYGLLIAAGAVHIIGGMPKLMRRAGKRAPKSLWRIAALTAGVLALGVLRIALAPPSTPSYLLERVRPELISSMHAIVPYGRTAGYLGAHSHADHMTPHVVIQRLGARELCAQLVLSGVRCAGGRRHSHRSIRCMRCHRVYSFVRRVHRTGAQEPAQPTRVDAISVPDACHDARQVTLLHHSALKLRRDMWYWKRGDMRAARRKRIAHGSRALGACRSPHVHAAEEVRRTGKHADICHRRVWCMRRCGARAEHTLDLQRGHVGQMQLASRCAHDRV